MKDLSEEEREELMPIIYKNDFNHIEELPSNPKLRHILKFYKDYRGDIANHESELYLKKEEFNKIPQKT